MEFLKRIIGGKVERAIAQCAIAILALAAIVAACFRLHLNIAAVALLFVMVIVLLARVGSFLPAGVVSIIAFFLLAYVAPPADSFRIDDWLDVVAVFAFATTALVIALLVSRLHQMSEEAVSSVNRKLIDAEERLRARIGKEFHDDIEQRLALLAVDIEQVSEKVSDPAGDVLKSLKGIRQQTSRIAADVQELLCELRPYKLQYLGVSAAMRSYCQEFGDKHNVEVEFKSHDLRDSVPLDLSLSLFRVLQEALQNSTRHSRTRHFEVDLFGALEAVHLTVHDSGVGFNSKAAMKGPGLGLISMRERLKLVDGTFLIDSQPKKGTTIHAFVPLPKQPAENSQFAYQTSGFSIGTSSSPAEIESGD